MPEDKREAVLDALEKVDLYDVAVSDDFAHSLAMYPDAPGQWLLAPWKRAASPSIGRRRRHT